MVEHESLAPFFLEKKMVPGKQREDVETLTLIPQYCYQTCGHSPCPKPGSVNHSSLANQNSQISSETQKNVSFTYTGESGGEIKEHPLPQVHLQVLK